MIKQFYNYLRLRFYIKDKDNYLYLVHLIIDRYLQKKFHLFDFN